MREGGGQERGNDISNRNNTNNVTGLMHSLVLRAVHVIDKWRTRQWQFNFEGNLPTLIAGFAVPLASLVAVAVVTTDLFVVIQTCGSNLSQ